jgi:hypothetical protein
VVFPGFTANAQLVPTIHVALHTSHAAHPKIQFKIIVKTPPYQHYQYFLTTPPFKHKTHPQMLVFKHKTHPQMLAFKHKTHPQMLTFKHKTHTKCSPLSTKLTPNAQL